MGGASFFVLGAALGQTEGHREGKKTRASASLSKVNPPQYPSEAYPELPLAVPGGQGHRGQLPPSTPLEPPMSYCNFIRFLLFLSPSFAPYKHGRRSRGISPQNLE